MLYFAVFIAVIATITNAFPTGAPLEACKDLRPRHNGVSPQEGPIPFTISVEKAQIAPGERVLVTIEGKNGEKFKGFMVQARVGETVVGNFEVDEKDEEIKTMNCPPGDKNTVTHRNSDGKSKLSLVWVAPENFQGTVVFKSTIAKDFKTFWVAETSSELTIKQ